MESNCKPQAPEKLNAKSVKGTGKSNASYTSGGSLAEGVSHQEKMGNVESMSPGTPMTQRPKDNDRI